MLEALVSAGMDVARLNLSHNTLDWHRERIELLRRVSADSRRPIGILLDLSGPKLRIGTLATGEIRLTPGDEFRLRMQPIEGNTGEVSVTYAGLADEVEVGDSILLADGTIHLEVTALEPSSVVCTVVQGGPLSSHQGINVPTRTLNLPSITAKDRQGLQAGLKAGVDFVALSFVRGPQDIVRLREILDEQEAMTPIIAKIEKHEALENLETILQEVDGLLVARGDLAVETPLEEVPQVQKRIIRAANRAAKPVIIATQMLRSMVDSSRPTRAETTDVANALYDGTDAVMLSEETAIGDYPVEAVKVMHRICLATEKDLLADPEGQPTRTRRGSVPDAVAAAACLVARHLDAAALLIPTRTGSTAIKVASFRPPQPIIAINTQSESVGRLTLTWGLIPIEGLEVPTHEAMLAEVERKAVEAGLLVEGELVVVTAGFPVGGPGTTNSLTVKAVGEELVTDLQTTYDQRSLFSDDDTP